MKNAVIIITDGNTAEIQFPDSLLRDWLAGQALAGLCANPGGPFQANGMSGWGIVNCKESDVAAYCVSLADAVLEALKARP